MHVLPKREPAEFSGDRIKVTGDKVETRPGYRQNRLAYPLTCQAEHCFRPKIPRLSSEHPIFGTPRQNLALDSTHVWRRSVLCRRKLARASGAKYQPAPDFSLEKGFYLSGSLSGHRACLKTGRNRNRNFPINENSKPTSDIIDQRKSGHPGPRIFGPRISLLY